MLAVRLSHFEPEADIECARLIWIKAKVQELFYCRRCCPFSQENVMKKMSMIGATLMGAAILCAAPISLHQSQVKGLSLSLDSADARVGHPATATSVAGVH